MTYEAGLSGFRSPGQAKAIANILEHMSTSDAYDEEEQAIAKNLSDGIRRFIKEDVILTNRLAYSRGQEDVLSEAFAIYVEAKRQ